MGLRLRFILAISTLLALVLAGNAYVFVIETARSLRAEIEARAVAFGTLAVEPLATAYDAYAASGRPSWGRSPAACTRSPPKWPRCGSTT